MIPSRQEIFYRIYGAWRLARFDAGGAAYFDAAPGAALRSFFAAALVAPAFIIGQLLAFSYAQVTTDANAVTVFLVFALEYCLLWVVPPVIVYRICQTIDREDAFFRFLSANNWSSVVTIHLQLAVTALGAVGLVPEALAPLVALATYAYMLGYQWFLTRHCLGVNALASAGFVALQFFIGLLIESITLNLIFQPAG
ncbi:MAG: hypothetical protein ACFB13_22320 [Kiloniellaceae bacterium]